MLWWSMAKHRPADFIETDFIEADFIEADFSVAL